MVSEKTAKLSPQKQGKDVASLLSDLYRAFRPRQVMRQVSDQGIQLSEELKKKKIEKKGGLHKVP